MAEVYCVLASSIKNVTAVYISTSFADSYDDTNARENDEASPMATGREGAKVGP